MNRKQNMMQKTLKTIAMPKTKSIQTFWIGVALIFSGCEGAGKLTLDPNSPGLSSGGSSIEVSNIPFGGVQSASQITGTSARLTWIPATGSVLSYAIYEVSTGVALFIGSTSANISEYVVTGLTPGQAYAFRVRLNDSQGRQDDNTKSVAVQTIAVHPPSNLSYSANPARYTTATPITANTPSVSGGGVTSYSVLPSLPTGLNFNTSTGIITGTPSVVQVPTSYTITASNAGGSTQTTITIGVVSFTGLSSIDNITSESMRLNWDTTSTGTTYFIYDVTSGTAVFKKTVVGPATHAVVSGLTPNTSYTFRVRVNDSSGFIDTNTSDQSATTLSLATHGGWTEIKALGRKRPAAQSSDLGTADAQVKLSWDATIVTGTIQSYSIYRASTSQGYDFTSPLATGITTAAKTYTDTTVLSGETYFYLIAPVVGGVAIPTSLANRDAEVKIEIPPDNMVLLHRWMANKEMCELMGKTGTQVLREEEYTCAFSGQTAIGGKLDYEKNLFVDAYEQGCNYTYDSSNNRCGASTGCIGILATPDGAISEALNTVYYSRNTGKCFINTNGSTGWTEANIASTSQLRLMGSNAPGLPPLVRLQQSGAATACSGHATGGYSKGLKRLLRRKEQLAVAAWPTMSDTDIDTLENGTNLHTTHACNSNYASPQGNSGTDITATVPTMAYTNTDFPTAKDTLPGCLNASCSSSTNAIRAVRTGSNATSACISRYGAQDMVGNVAEWTSDQVECGATYYVSSKCRGRQSSVDLGNEDFVNVEFDGYQGSTSSNTIWAASGNTGRFQLPIGIPIAGAYTADGVVTRTSTQLHGDSSYIQTGSAIRGLLAGFAWYSGAAAGRFGISLQETTTFTDMFNGSRCALPTE